MDWCEGMPCLLERVVNAGEHMVAVAGGRAAALSDEDATGGELRLATGAQHVKIESKV